VLSAHERAGSTIMPADLEQAVVALDDGRIVWPKDEGGSFGFTMRRFVPVPSTNVHWNIAKRTPLIM
jgi:hypothetical protein